MKAFNVKNGASPSAGANSRERRTVIPRRGQPPVLPAPRKLGTADGDFRVPDDFDAPLPEEIWRDLNVKVRPSRAPGLREPPEAIRQAARSPFEVNDATMRGRCSGGRRVQQQGPHEEDAALTDGAGFGRDGLSQ